MRPQSPADRRIWSVPCRAISLGRHDSAIPRSLAVWAVGLFRRRASSPARRRNSGGLGAGISDSPQAAIAVAPGGGSVRAGELRLLEWEAAAPERGAAPRQQDCSIRQAGPAGQASPPENAY